MPTAASGRRLPGDTDVPVPALNPVLPGGPYPHIGPGPVPYPVSDEYTPDPEPGADAAAPADAASYTVGFQTGDPRTYAATEWVPVRQRGRFVRVLAADLRTGDIVPNAEGQFRTVVSVAPA